jgi:hypothetical protein
MLVFLKAKRINDNTINYHFKHNFQDYKEIEKALGEVAPKASVDILDQVGNEPTHELIKVEFESLIIQYKEWSD